MLHLSQMTACWALPASSKAPEHWLIACLQFMYQSHKLTSHQIFKPEILSKSRFKKQRPFSKDVTLSFSCWQSCSETVKKTRASFNHGTTHSTLWTWLTSYRWLPNSLERKKSSFTQNSTKYRTHVSSILTQGIGTTSTFKNSIWQSYRMQTLSLSLTGFRVKKKKNCNKLQVETLPLSREA